jgi:hypothetical protein
MNKAENLTPMFDAIPYTAWDPQHPTNLDASTACYGDRFIVFT